ncbi:MAG: 4Fe-4S binding protein, partial [Firmicutes bacterium]|nr:4Fe-4S binding protein [Bacillota bacterium]
AISGKVKEPFVIDQERCIKCGACKETCRFDAVEEVA